MDSQPTTPNSSSSGERQGGVKPEDLRAEAPSVEAADAAGPAPSVAPAQPAARPAKLTPDEAAAAAGIMPAASAPQQPAAGAVQGPALAGDVDVIEPEWVEKAEDVVRQTQGDPYNEEEAIEDLQQDYLLKRYGHEVADPKAGDSKGT
jgi:hypothetical protein